jgi:hypothetical protein
LCSFRPCFFNRLRKEEGSTANVETGFACGCCGLCSGFYARRDTCFCRARFSLAGGGAATCDQSNGFLRLSSHRSLD